MRKVLAAILAVLLLFAGCMSETPEEIPAEIPEKEPAVSVPEEAKTDYEWEKFIKEMEKHGYSKEDIESLEAYGYTCDEITAMTWVDVVRGLGMIRFGFEREEVESALEILRNGTAKDDETFVLSGDETIRYELIEEFISAVEKNEEAFVHGIMTGHTMPYYFELSYEPGGMIEYSMISEHLVSKSEFSEIYDTEAFYSFRNEEKTFSVPKVELWPGEQLKFSPLLDVPDMPVTLNDAKKIATEVMFKSCLANDEYEFTEEYLNSLEPKCEGVFDVAGKPHYLIYFYEGENFVGEGYYVCADESEIVFGVSMADGRLMPVAPNSKPRIVLEKD